MKYISTLLSHLRPVQILLFTLLSVVLFFGSGFPALADKSAPTEGTVQLNKIEEKTKEAIDAPPMSLKTAVEQSKGGVPNEVQGNADRDKMKHSDDTELPVVKQVEKALDKMKKN